MGYFVVLGAAILMMILIGLNIYPLDKDEHVEKERVEDIQPKPKGGKPDI